MNEQDLGATFGIFNNLDFGKIIILILGIVALGLCVRLAKYIGDNLNKRQPSRRLLIAQVLAVTSFLIYIVGGGYLFYGVLKPTKAVILGVSGTLAVALGLSIKDLVSSIVAGVILLFDRPFQVGDRVKFGEIYGEIKTVGLRAVQLITLDDSVVTIPNSLFITEAVSSGNFGNLDMMIEIDFHLPLNADLRKAREILHETVVTSKFSYLKKPVSIVFSETEFAFKQVMQLKVKCYVIDVRFEKALQTDILVRGNEALISFGIRKQHDSNNIDNRLIAIKGSS